MKEQVGGEQLELLQKIWEIEIHCYEIQDSTHALITKTIEEVAAEI